MTGPSGSSGPPEASTVSFSWKHLPQLAREVSTRAGAAAVAAGVPRDCRGIPSDMWLKFAAKVLIYLQFTFLEMGELHPQRSLGIFGNLWRNYILR